MIGEEGMVEGDLRRRMNSITELRVGRGGDQANLSERSSFTFTCRFRP
jgi:hypothetical protein